MTSDERAESWPRRQLRTVEGRQDQALGVLIASTSMALFAALAVWNGQNTPNDRFLYVAAGLAACASLAIYYWMGGAYHSPLQAGIRAEERALHALAPLGLEVLAWPNLRPEGWNEDLDLVVLTKTKLVVVEVKADPGRLIARDDRIVSQRRGVNHDLGRHERRAQTLAVRFKLELIHAAKNGKLPPGIPTPHHVVAIDPLHPSPHARTRHVCHVEALAEVIEALTDNLPPGLRTPLAQHLEDSL